MKKSTKNILFLSINVVTTIFLICSILNDQYYYIPVAAFITFLTFINYKKIVIINFFKNLITSYKWIYYE